MAQRMVNCVKFGKELPGMRLKPFPDEFGQKLFDSVSQEAWTLWLEHSKMIINEYGWDLVDAGVQKKWRDLCDQFFFGEGATLPPDWVPPKKK